MKVRIAGIKPNDIVDGIGICVSVWYQGCPHKCHGCHNPETWAEDGGIEYSNEDLIKEVDSLITANEEILEQNALISINNNSIINIAIINLTEIIPTNVSLSTSVSLLQSSILRICGTPQIW